MKDSNFFLIAGPCMLESKELGLQVAKEVKKITQNLEMLFFFKSSFDKANRSSIKSSRGPGLIQGIKWLKEIKQETQLPILSDVHTPEMIERCSDVLDIIQIPAFLARQTDFYVEAAKTGKKLNVKKGQFMSPHEIENMANKFIQSGGKKENLIITERGTFFGYGDLVVDFRSIKVIRDLGLQYVFDASHSVQRPAARGEASGGDSKFIELLSYAQMMGNADGVFIETHPDVKSALSDKESQYPLHQLEMFVTKINKIIKFRKEIYHN